MARVALFFGGRSEEHDVSCVSAVSTLEALESRGHDVVAVGIGRDGVWHLADPSRRPLAAKGSQVLLEVPGGRLMAEDEIIEVEVAFPVLHGPFGEDGTIQGLFEMAGLAYVGSGVLGSAMAMDKDVANRLCREAGLPVGDYLVVRRSAYLDDPADTVTEVGDDLGFPVFVKPAALGSSVGISRADDEGTLKEAIDEALGHGPKVIVEKAVVGREIEVAVLEGPRASVPGEIVVKEGWYTYDAKYRDDATELVVPAHLHEAEAATVRAMACKAFEVLECRGLARVDFFYEEDGRGFLVNELNTMPGFTPKSMFPMMWAATGMPYAELCDELVSLAVK
ncbi:MAG TPA: D-alanine--D-alanine ligase family protein [Acidimicrobiia bacterium]|nr:D-alanine--D-alanine ligase family protein [Acidimicrobiia bacterium]